MLGNGLTCEVAFYDLDNIREYEEQGEDGEAKTRYEVDKFKIVLVNKPAYIEDNVSELLQLAKAKEYNDLAEKIRAKRDKLLADTDWTQCTDCQLSNTQKEAYRVYRQALRDVPEQAGFPYQVVFPKL